MAILLKTTCGNCYTTFQVKLDYAQRVGFKCNNCGSQVPASAVRGFLGDDQFTDEDTGRVFTLISAGHMMDFSPRSVID